MKNAETSVVILGAGGHGRVVLDTCRAAGIPVAGFLDGRHETGSLIHGAQVLGSDDELESGGFLHAHRFIVALGDQEARKKLSSTIRERGGRLATAIHPSCIISTTASIAEGTVVVAGAIINTDSQIGRYCIINTGATIDHDVCLEDGVQVSPGANLAGHVHCEEQVFIGTGAIIAPRVTVEENSIIGAGSVVLKDVPKGVLVAGNPATKIRKA
ncbi:MAG: acetyltransferase [Rickettsiales bacterium]